MRVFVKRVRAVQLLLKWMMSLWDEAEAAVNDMQRFVALRYSDFYAAFDGENLWMARGLRGLGEAREQVLSYYQAKHDGAVNWTWMISSRS